MVYRGANTAAPPDMRRAVHAGDRFPVAGKKTRIDFAADAAPLTDSPFAALAAAAGARDAETTPAPGVTAAKAWKIMRTRKGGWPLRVEKRPSGKVVTVVSNVTAGHEALLAELKKRCAAGGKVTDGGLEIQGDHAVKIAAFLDQSA